MDKTMRPVWLRLSLSAGLVAAAIGPPLPTPAPSSPPRPFRTA